MSSNGIPHSVCGQLSNKPRLELRIANRTLGRGRGRAKAYRGGPCQETRTTASRYRPGHALTYGPYITDREFHNAPASTDCYQTGEHIKARVASNSAVAATSTPMLKLQIEGTQRTSTCRSGDSAATEFVFAYTVVVGTHLKVNAWYSALIKSFWRREGSHRNGQQQRERKRAGLVLMIGALGATVCGGSDEPELPDTTAASVLAYLEEVDYRESWELWPGRGEKYQGDDPHGILLTTYLNPCRL